MYWTKAISGAGLTHLESRCSTVPGLPEYLQPDTLHAILEAVDAEEKRWHLSLFISVEADGKLIRIGSPSPILLRGIRSEEDAKTRAEKTISKYAEKLEQFAAFIQTRMEKGPW